MTRSQVRAAYLRALLTSGRYRDFFCLIGSGLRVGYPSRGLLGSLSSRQRKNLAGRAIWMTTANQHYSVRGIRSGLKLEGVKDTLAGGDQVRIGRTVWYLLSSWSATALVEVRGGVVREIGIASPQLTRTHAAAALLVRNLS